MNTELIAIKFQKDSLSYPGTLSKTPNYYLIASNKIDSNIIVQILPAALLNSVRQGMAIDFPKKMPPLFRLFLLALDLLSQAADLKLLEIDMHAPYK